MNIEFFSPGLHVGNVGTHFPEISQLLVDEPDSEYPESHLNETPVPTEYCIGSTSLFTILIGGVSGVASPFASGAALQVTEKLCNTFSNLD